MTVTAPLAGLTVIEIEGIGPVPFAGMMLADLGARVILVERKSANRNAGIATEKRAAELFHRGKQSIAIDLKHPQGVELVSQLIKEADILIEGLRPGAMERIGLGPEICLQHNPQLIYGRLSGWGQTGPLAKAAGHEPNYAAISGALWYGGREKQPPTAPLSIMSDVGAGSMSLIVGILAAVIQRATSNKGQVIDAAISDSSAYNSTLLWSLFHMGLLQQGFGKSWVDGAAPWNETYACKDQQFVTICALEPNFYQQLIQTLGLQDNPLMQKQWDQLQWPAMKQLLAETFLSQPQSYWIEKLQGSDCCFAPVLDFQQAPQHPHNIARETFITRNNLCQPAPVPKFSQARTEAGVPPQKSQHSELILQQLSFSPDEIKTLIKEGVI